ncbi:hypothetical protein [Thalassoglobus polymorphus]|uniref:Uncharacterized protein n=1 Tax=Thalassoglobus polymorphus TaxID=2527994 RepID=A0A517QRJ5_9PLAN|nr:hypothetical protein [Thalassoglobus polymorphus]QDT34252.1 hypothetical protein Mal48_35120 [Thalassoglobus polymorphus]
MTTCETFRQRLDQRVEERDDLTPEIVDHFRSCDSPECQNHFAEYQLLNAAIKDWKAVLPQIDFVDAVVGDVKPTMKPVMVNAPTPPQARSQFESLNHSQSAESRTTSLVSLTTVLAVLSLCILLVIGTVPRSIRQVAQNPPVQETSLATNGIETDVEKNEMQAEAELRELGKTYGSWVQGAANKLTDTMSVGFNDASVQPKKSHDWFTNLSEQMEPIESKLDATFKLILEENSSEMDDQTFAPTRSQNEYLGLFLSKSMSLKPLFTLMLV